SAPGSSRVHGGVSLKLPWSRSVGATAITTSLPCGGSGSTSPLHASGRSVVRDDDVTVGHLDAFRPQAPGVVGLVAGDEPARGGDHPPPRHVVVRGRQDAPDRPGRAG